jgi:hypothetical protein
VEIMAKAAPDHPNTAWVRRNLGRLAYRERDLRAARVLYEQSLAGLKRSAPDSPLTAATLYSLALLLDEEGQLPEAIARLEEAAHLMEARAPFYPEASAPEILRHLAALYRNQGDAARSEAALRRARKLEEGLQSLPSGGPDASRPSPPPIGIDRPLSAEAIARVPIQPAGAPTLPQVVFVAPGSDSEVTSNPEGTSFHTAIRVRIFSPIPARVLHISVNGRRISGEGRPVRDTIGQQAATRVRGRILEKGTRDAQARELPPDQRSLAENPRFAQYEELDLGPVEVPITTGPYVRIGVAAESTGGTTGPLAVLRLRNPKAEGFRGRLRVLAIGVGAYRSLDALRYPAADARELAAAFRGQAGSGKLYRKAEIRTLIDREATLASIREALAWLAREARPDETLIVALSGHGLKDGGQSYFAPVDADPARLSQTALPWRELLEALQKARRNAKAIWLLADCCRVAPGLSRERRPSSDDLRRGLGSNADLILCTASKGDQPSYEDSSLGHGLFTRAWLEALRGEAPEARYQLLPAWGRALTHGELNSAVSMRVDELAHQIGVRQDVFFPQEILLNYDAREPLFVAVPVRR